jgi:hypothetical protein
MAARVFDATDDEWVRTAECAARAMQLWGLLMIERGFTPAMVASGLAGAAGAVAVQIVEGSR